VVVFSDEVLVVHAEGQQSKPMVAVPYLMD
jgi:hypothetical protein